ncbi:dUTP diphosphatase [Xanthobacter sp. KR7-225]|uniref:dUTP diphosphatase n=1 Tax=Xanthobacter sp. KR7-225 TaxID=3156613 RepID=UPI0032B37844
MSGRGSVPVLRLLRLPHGADLPLPHYASADAAGLDLVAAVPAEAPMVLAPGAFAAVPTGLAMALPSGFEGQVRPRSGLALKFGVTVLNAPGTVDADYRGEVMAILINHGPAPFVITRGMRIAQLVVAPVSQIMLEETGDLGQTARGVGGFGSTGLGGA